MYVEINGEGNKLRTYLDYVFFRSSLALARFLLFYLLQWLLVSNAVGVAIGVPSDMEAVDWAAALEQVNIDNL